MSAFFRRLCGFLGAALLLEPTIIFAQSCSVGPKLGGNCWTTEDVIDEHIDHHAQGALLRMFASGGNTASDASSILCAVKSQRLEGIYLPDQGVPALRAKSARSAWWQIIPDGELSTCFKEPADRSPLISFRKQIKDNRDMVASAISAAWRNCNIPTTTTRCYITTISKPASGGGGTLVTNLVDPDGKPFPHNASVGVLEIDRFESAVLSGAGSIEFALTPGKYSVQGSSNPQDGQSMCESGPVQDVKIETNLTVVIHLKIPYCAY